jgi:hypothetical protein
MTATKLSTHRTDAIETDQLADRPNGLFNVRFTERTTIRVRDSRVTERVVCLVPTLPGGSHEHVHGKSKRSDDQRFKQG